MRKLPNSSEFQENKYQQKSTSIQLFILCIQLTYSLKRFQDSPLLFCFSTIPHSLGKPVIVGGKKTQAKLKPLNCRREVSPNQPATNELIVPGHPASNIQFSEQLFHSNKIQNKPGCSLALQSFQQSAEGNSSLTAQTW